MYEIKLDRSKGTRLGFKLDVQVATRSLFIKEVVGGLAFTWNTAHQDQKVRPGDRIVRVNKADGDAHRGRPLRHRQAPLRELPGGANRLCEQG